MLSPKRTKYRRQHRGHMRGKASRGATIAYGDYALRALEPAWITARQIEAGRRAMTRQSRRGAKIWIRIFPDKPITKRPADTRMGSGKGDVDRWVAVVKPGKILFEIRGVSRVVAMRALVLAGCKMPVRTSLVVSSKVSATKVRGASKADDRQF